MADKGAILNGALHHLGEDEVQDPLTNTTTWIARVRDRYAAKATLLLEKHPINFATSFQQLTATEPTPDGWMFGFNKPAQCLRIIKVQNTTSPNDGGITYEDRAGRICTNAETTYLKFVDGLWLTREGSWPQVFADALSAELAQAVVPVTAGNDAFLRIQGEAKRTLREFKNWDAQQQPAWTPPPSKWQAGRFNRLSGSRGDCG